MKRPILHGLSIVAFILILTTPLSIFLKQKALAGPMEMEGLPGQSGSTPVREKSGPASLPSTNFFIEGFLGADTSFSGAYGTTTGQNVPYNFGMGPLWGIRGGKRLFPTLVAYLTVVQSDFSRNTHTIAGLGANDFLPSIANGALLPYLNATFGASYNTYTGVNAQAGYAWMLGAGALYPISHVVGVFLEADLSYETAPTGITTSLGQPPGVVSRVSDAWSVPVFTGIRYAF